ncbi:MAG: cysteine desulfurase [Armatimonadota bacterium]|nr:cysteine desulfurase [Armatimonadota bacterium]
MIYLDNAATTPLDPRAREAMLPWLDCANPSSLHHRGREARMAIDVARELVADAMECIPGEVIFTSSGTEAVVTALLGAARAGLSGSRKRILMGAAEHHAVLHCEKQLRELGYKVEFIPPTSAGAFDVSRLVVADDVLLVAAMHANNETGAITDVSTVASLCRDRGALFFCDAVQTFGKVPLPDADLIAASAHKVYGPKGVGALRVRAGVKIEPVMAGGGQEREMRGGTENVAAIVGFGEVCRAGQTCPTGPTDAFVSEVRRLVPHAVFIALDAPCLPTHAHLRIPGVSAEVALINLDRLGVAASSGAACSSGSVEPSHVLLAMGLNETQAAEGLRFTFGRQTTVEEAKQAASCLAEICPPRTV